ncbi:hypothetical protein SAMN05444000_12554 [Shimia gijangensis]|uniref:Uncharacterized protein n=1 Tax=Shimia gijangensis TaxID=1470563 RepID=A0A1M6RJ06_9RHOB|nr:hypothetical protein SAMN05444000_12554 [Shimia gijangensis]
MPAPLCVVLEFWIVASSSNEDFDTRQVQADEDQEGH